MAAEPESGSYPPDATALRRHCTGVCANRAEADRLFELLVGGSSAQRSADLAAPGTVHRFDTKYLGARTLSLRPEDARDYLRLFVEGVHDAELRRLPPEPLVLDGVGVAGLFALRVRIMRPLASVVVWLGSERDEALFGENTSGFYEVTRHRFSEGSTEVRRVADMRRALPKGVDLSLLRVSQTQRRAPGAQALLASAGSILVEER